METTADAHRDEVRRHQNALQSVLLLAVVWTMVTIPAVLFWGWPGIATTTLILAGLCLLSPTIPPEAVMRLYRATHVPEGDSQLSSLVDVLAFRAGLERRPQLYVVPSMTLNAFAAGTPDHSAIAVTEGLLRRLTLRETAGVIAHEIAHIKNGDLEVMGLADVLTRLLQLLSYAALVLAAVNVVLGLTGEQAVSWWAVLALYLAPVVSNLAQLALSRAREFDADLTAAEVTGDAMGLASALRRLETYTGHFWEDLMFPVPARRIPNPSLLRSHPDTESRVSRLLERGSRASPEPLRIVEQPMISLVGLGPIEMRPRYRWPGLWY